MANLTPELAALQEEIEGYAREYGLDFFETIFEVLDWKQINEVASYGGFPNRYRHWRFGMEYEQLSKSYEYGLSKIYEMVINNDPCYAYLLHSNHFVDQKLVMAHVYGHCDFFKNNYYFSHTNRKMMDEMANHKTRIQRYIDRYGLDNVENFLDACLSIDTLIDYHAPAITRNKPRAVILDEEGEEVAPVVQKLPITQPYMDKYINPPEFMAEEQEKIRQEAMRAHKFPESHERDVMGFLVNYAPLERWERDVLDIVREEAYYFAPQAQTKIMNEGWACVTGDTRIITNRGNLKAKEIVANKLPVRVFDGKKWQRIVDWAHFPSRKTVRLQTRRGFVIEGSATPQLLVSGSDSWKRLDELKKGDDITIVPTEVAWPSACVALDWKPVRRRTLEDVADEVGVNLSTVVRYRAGTHASRKAAELAPVVEAYKNELQWVASIAGKRKTIQVPNHVDERLAQFLGYLTGDGHVSKVKRVLGLTTMDEEPKSDFVRLGQELFGIDAVVRKDGRRWRLLFHSEDLSDFLIHIGMTHGPSARRKSIPECIWCSPKRVVAAFLRAYFDCDGYAGKQGVILSTFSDALAVGVQNLLLQFGILSRRRRSGGGWHVHITGYSAATYAKEIGFGIVRKQQALEVFLDSHIQWKCESENDEIVSIDVGVQDVYDFTVENTHRYVAHGFINHNSYWHSKIMTTRALKDDELIDYADHHSGTMAMGPNKLNPYKIGIELLRDIEDRWNKGRFGKEYDECSSMVEKAKWDRQLGLGRQKIFEVRKLYSDLMFVDEFLTPEFCKQHKLFVYAYNLTTDQYEVADRTFAKIKQQLLQQLTNFGHPLIAVEDANFSNRGELLLDHQFEGVEIQLDRARETLKNLYRIWKRPVNIRTILSGTPKILSFDGAEYKEFRP
jgi:stage V sporulation protein R